MQSGRSDNRPASMPLVYYSCAKASRNFFSCSSGRLVEMTSKSYCLSSSITLSGAVAPLVRANSADVPSVTFSRTCLIKSSSMPTSDIAPDIPPIAAPRKGMKKIIPIRNPQNAPQPARAMQLASLGLPVALGPADYSGVLQGDQLPLLHALQRDHYPVSAVRIVE